MTTLDGTLTGIENDIEMERRQVAVEMGDRDPTFCQLLGFSKSNPENQELFRYIKYGRLTLDLNDGSPIHDVKSVESSGKLSW
jgi:hypothetical protein